MKVTLFSNVVLEVEPVPPPIAIDVAVGHDPEPPIDCVRGAPELLNVRKPVKNEPLLVKVWPLKLKVGLPEVGPRTAPLIVTFPLTVDVPPLIFNVAP